MVSKTSKDKSSATTADLNSLQGKKLGRDIDSGTDTESEDETYVSSDYLFPSFFVFVLYGPFVPASDRLNIYLTNNKDKKKGDGTRAEIRKRKQRIRYWTRRTMPLLLVGLPQTSG